MIQYIQAKKFPLELFILLISVLLFVPSILIHSDVPASGFVPEDFVFLWLICFGGLLASAALSWLLPRFSTLIHRAAGALALYILVTSIFYPIQSGVLDGREASSISLWDIHTHLILALICFLTYWHSIKVAPKVLAILGCLAFLFSGYVTFYELGKLGKRPDAAQLMELGTDENIIILSLDALHGLLVKQILEENLEFQDAFTGFTLYENSISTAWNTILSTVSLMRGSLPELGKLGKPQDEVHENNNLLDDLKSAGFVVSYCHFSSSPNPSSPNILIKDLLQVTNTFSYILATTKRFAGHTLKVLPGFPAEFGTRGKEEDKAALNLWIENLHVNPNIKKKAIYYHSFMTHMPVRFDKEGNYHENREMIYFKDELYFAITRVVALLQTLKDQNLYDKTTIIITGDHGIAIQGQPIEIHKKIYAPMPDAYGSVTGYDIALLIKPAKATGNMCISPIPQILSDLRKTLAIIVGIKGQKLNSIPGQDILKTSLPLRQIEIATIGKKHWKHEWHFTLEPWLKTTITLPYR